jgi:hypothetical protein
MDPADLQDVVDRALRELPGPRAPRTLLPRVMAAVRQQQNRTAQNAVPQELPSAGRTWFRWPLGWQAASVAALILLVMGLGWVLPSAQAAVSDVTADAMTSIKARVATVAEDASDVAGIARVLWQAALQPILGYVFVFILVMSAASAALGVAVGRVALGGASQL